MGHIGCDMAHMAFSPQGVTWALAIFGLIRFFKISSPYTCIKFLTVSHT